MIYFYKISIILLNIASSIISFVYFFYLLFLSNNKKLFKIVSILFLIIGLGSIANIYYFIDIENEILKKIIFFCIILLSFLLNYFILYVNFKDKKKSFIFFIFILFYSLILTISLFINFKLFLIFISILNFLVFLHIVIINITRRGNIVFYIFSSSFLISLIISTLIFFFERYFIFKNNIYLNLFEIIKILYINLFKYFTFFLGILFLLQIRKFLLFDYIGGVWQNYIINKVDIPYVFIDSNDNIIYANESFLKIWQGDLGNIKNINMNNILNFEKGILSCFNNEKIPIAYEIYPLKTKNSIKKIVLVKSLIEDISIEEEREKEEDYRIKYEKIKILFHNLLEYFPKAILIVNEKGIIEYSNYQFASIFKINKDSIVGESILQIFLQLGFLKNFNEKDIEESIEFVKKLENKNLEIKDNFFNIQIKEIEGIFEEDIEKTIKYLITINDYSVIQKNKIALEKYINTLDIFINKNILPICLTDSDGFISLVNQKFTQYFDFQSKINIFTLSKNIEKIIKKNYKKILNNEILFLGDYIVFGEKIENITEIYSKEIFLSKDFLDKIIEKKSTNLKYKIFSIHCFALFQNLNYSLFQENPYQFAFLFIDVTNDILSKRELITNLKNSKSTLKKMDLLINNINHEMRTPLNIISGFVELLKIEKHDDQISRKIMGIDKSVEKIKKIIEEIISSSSFADKEKELIEINLKPFIEDYKSYMYNSFKMTIKSNVLQMNQLNIKINLRLFKKLMTFIIDNYKNYDFIELNINIINKPILSALSAWNEKFLVISLNVIDEKLPNQKEIILPSNEFDFIKIVLNFLVFLLKGEIKFKSDSQYNFLIKIPVKII
jgi:nitrogen-specific signal transduction histidine kinase